MAIRSYGYGSNLLSNFAYTLESWGLYDVILPFLLIFTILFAILQRTKILGSDSTVKKFNVTVSLVIALIVVFPHMLGAYPAGYDVVDIINNALPSVALLAIAIIMLLLILGIFGGEYQKGALSTGMIVISILAIGYIFGAAAGLFPNPEDIIRWWTPELTSLLIIILIFGAIIAFVTSEERGEQAEQAKAADQLQKGFKKMFGGGSG